MTRAQWTTAHRNARRHWTPGYVPTAPAFVAWNGAGWVRMAETPREYAERVPLRYGTRPHLGIAPRGAAAARTHAWYLRAAAYHRPSATARIARRRIEEARAYRRAHAAAIAARLP